MIIFNTGIDYRAREPNKPTIASFYVSPARGYEYIVIGTDYGYIHTSSGDVRTWRSKSGAYKFAKQYGA